MSANKGFVTKIHEDVNTDSGFLSGPIDQLPSELEDVDEAGVDSDSKNVASESTVEVNLDSGLCLSECLSSLSVEEATRVAARPALSVTDAGDTPPLVFLFQQDDDGDTQLHIAAVHGCEKSVSTLIRVCPARYWLDLPNDYGHTALHLAVLSGHAVVTRMLVIAGASLAVRDLQGNTPLHTATAANSVECLNALLNPLHSQRSSKAYASVLNMKNYNGQTCLHLAANSGHISTMQTVLYYGADINAREGLAGWTALHVAARRGDLAVTQCLLKHPGLAVRAKDYAGRTPRRLARRAQAFSSKDGQRLFKAMPEESDSETDSDDEYDSDDGESLFEKIRGQITATSLVSN